MTNEDAVKWLENLKQDIGQLRHEDLWPYAQAIDEIIDMLDEQKKRNEPIKPDMIMTTSAGIPMSHCPNCDEPINQYRHPKFCGACGQVVKYE